MSAQRLSAAQLHANLAGRWPDILVALGIPQTALTKRHGACPMCGGKDRFRFDDKEGKGRYFCNGCGAGDGFTFVQRMHGWDFKTAVARVKEVAGLRDDDSPPRCALERRAESQSERPRDWSATADAIWRRTSALHGTLGEVYLRQRGCVLPPCDSDLRYLAPDDRHPPTLCARLTDVESAKPISLHFTKLAADGRGKAGSDKDKTFLRGHRKARGVVRLWPNECVTVGVGVAEGIETALAAAWGFAPIWSALDAGNLAALPVLAGIEALMIFADHDEVGLRAAHACAERWREVAAVTIVRPEAPGTDIADTVVTT